MRVNTWILSLIAALSLVTMNSVNARDADRNFDETMQRHIWNEQGRVYYYGPYGERYLVKKYRWEHERFENRDEMGIGSINHPDRLPDHR